MRYGNKRDQFSGKTRAIIVQSAIWGLGLVFSVLIAHAAAQARDDYNTTTWQTEDGLPNNGVLAILQSPNGYLWVGTSRGLARFDGVRFTDFTPKNEPGLVSERIWRLCADQRGGFWIAGDDGNLRTGAIIGFNVLLLAENHIRAKHSRSAWTGKTASGS